MDIDYLKRIVEGALLAAASPLSLNQLNGLFPTDEQPGHGPLREALAALDSELGGRAVELKEVGSGYRLQIRTNLMPFISQLWTEKPPRYSRALLETMAIIAYRQPITRGEIEQIRGVAVSSNILRTLQEREWVKVIGHRDVPGRPELLGTTRAFLDYFDLKSLDELPTLAEIKDIDNLEPELELPPPLPDRPDAENHDDEQTEIRPSGATPEQIEQADEATQEKPAPPDDGDGSRAEAAASDAAQAQDPQNEIEAEDDDAEREADH